MEQRTKFRLGGFIAFMAVMILVVAYTYVTYDKLDELEESIWAKAGDTVGIMDSSDTLVIRDPRVHIIEGFPVGVTFYQPVASQCDDSPWVTANNSKITEDSYYNWCAVSRDLMYLLVNFGDTIIVENCEGEVIKLVVKDLMNLRYSGMIDILAPPDAVDKISRDYRIYPFIKNGADCKITKIIRL